MRYSPDALKGLYFAINVQPTDELQRAAAELPASFGVPKPPSRRHVTITIAEHFPRAGIETTDEARMTHLRDRVTEELTAADIVGSLIKPTMPYVARRKNFAMVPIEPTGAILRAHDIVSAAVEAEFGYRLPLGEHHLALTRRPHGESWANVVQPHPLPPLRGFLLGEGFVKVMKSGNR